MTYTFSDLDEIWSQEPTNKHGISLAAIDLCQKASASDFYFSLYEDSEDDYCYTVINIVPKDYFDSIGHMFDQGLMIDHLLPPDFTEAMESVYESERPSVEVRQDLLQRGFLESEGFSNFIKRTYD